MNILSLKQYVRYATPIIGVIVIATSILAAPMLRQGSAEAARWKTEAMCRQEAASSSDEIYLFNCINNESVEGMVYRAYRVVLGRSPDRGGFNFWVNVANQAVNSGKNPTDVVVSRMMGSAEYNRIGTGMPLKHYVERVYQQTFGNTRDQAGINYWVNQINTGKTSYTKFLAYVTQAEQTKTAWGIETACYVTNFQLCAG